MDWFRPEVLMSHEQGVSTAGRSLRGPHTSNREPTVPAQDPQALCPLQKRRASLCHLHLSVFHIKMITRVSLISHGHRRYHHAPFKVWSLSRGAWRQGRISAGELLWQVRRVSARQPNLTHIQSMAGSWGPSHQSTSSCFHCCHLSPGTNHLPPEPILPPSNCLLPGSLLAISSFVHHFPGSVLLPCPSYSPPAQTCERLSGASEARTLAGQETKWMRRDTDPYTNDPMETELAPCRQTYFYKMCNKM